MFVFVVVVVLMDGLAGLICDFCLSVPARKLMLAHPPLQNMLPVSLRNQGKKQKKISAYARLDISVEKKSCSLTIFTPMITTNAVFDIL